MRSIFFRAVMLIAVMAGTSCSAANESTQFLIARAKNYWTQFDSRFVIYYISKHRAIDPPPTSRNIVAQSDLEIMLSHHSADHEVIDLLNRLTASKLERADNIIDARMAFVIAAPWNNTILTITVSGDRSVFEIDGKAYKTDKGFSDWMTANIEPIIKDLDP